MEWLHELCKCAACVWLCMSVQAMYRPIWYTCTFRLLSFIFVYILTRCEQAGKRCLELMSGEILYPYTTCSLQYRKVYTVSCDHEVTSLTTVLQYVTLWSLGYCQYWLVSMSLYVIYSGPERHSDLGCETEDSLSAIYERRARDCAIVGTYIYSLVCHHYLTWFYKWSQDLEQQHIISTRGSQLNHHPHSLYTCAVGSTHNIHQRQSTEPSPSFTLYLCNWLNPNVSILKNTHKCT